jgi:hypothetical protein
MTSTREALAQGRCGRQGPNSMVASARQPLLSLARRGARDGCTLGLYGKGEASTVRRDTLPGLPLDCY